MDHPSRCDGVSMFVLYGSAEHGRHAVSALICGDEEAPEMAHMIRVVLRRVLNSALDPLRRAQLRALEV